MNHHTDTHSPKPCRTYDDFVAYDQVLSHLFFYCYKTHKDHN